MLEGGVVSNLNSLVSVILPVYNCERFIRQSIESILNQSYKNIELIVIDDGSNDNSLKIINSYLYDIRLVVISRENKGLVFTLNEGIKISKGEYVARMDADDICDIKRLQKQVDFLNRNKKVAVVGCSYHIITEGDEVIGCRRFISSDFYLKSICLIGSPFAHPTVMFNKKLLGNDLVYDEKYKHAEDYELWLRLSKKYKFNSIREPLFSYRIVSNGVSKSNYVEQKLLMLKAANTYIFDSSLTKDEGYVLLGFYEHKKINKKLFLIILRQKNKLHALFQCGYLLLTILTNR